MANRIINDLREDLRWFTYLLQPDADSQWLNVKKNMNFFETFQKHFDVPSADVTLLVDSLANLPLLFAESSSVSLGPAPHSSINLLSEGESSGRIKNLEIKAAVLVLLSVALFSILSGAPQWHR